MSQEKTLTGTIEEKNTKEETDWSKTTYKVKKGDKTTTLGLFHTKENKDLVEKFRKGDKAKFTYQDTEKEGRTYHNISNIEAPGLPTEDLDFVKEEVQTGSRKTVTSYIPDDTIQKLIVRQNCLGNAIQYHKVFKPKPIVDVKVVMESVLNVAEIFETWVWRDIGGSDTPKVATGEGLKNSSDFVAYYCKDCKTKIINQAVIAHSMNTYKEPVCWDCQKKR